MNDFGFINKLDKYRVLLTEVLPYETPLWFTNEFFHSLCRKNEDGKIKLPAFIKDYLFYENHKNTQHEARIPLNYRIKKDTLGERELSIMHPSIQLEVVKFYEKYKDIIIYNCNQENTSLRRPVKIAGRFLNSKSSDTPEKIGVEEQDIEREYCSSFFVYEKMGFIYKFYESYEFHRLEKKFPFLIKLDIARCFNHIYTHSIAWALKSKDFVKENLNKPSPISFAGEFDRLMQSSNYNETNGILIGPEISRIFAEIILQKVDRDIIGLLRKENLFLKKDYDIRRYVDDYFFFYKKETLKNKILDAINKSLEPYRLYINERKSEFYTRPFISNLTMCKKELLDLINAQFGNFRYKKIFSIEKSDDGFSDALLEKNIIRNISFHKSSRAANRFIVDLKMIIQKYNVEYKSISGFFLSCMRRRINDFVDLIIKLESSKELKEAQKYKKWLLVDIEVIFFIYAMDFRVRPTIIIARMIQKILEIITDEDDETESLIIKKIFDGGNTVLKNHEAFQDNSSIEILNLLLILNTKLGVDFLISEERLLNLFFKYDGDKEIGLSYFEWTTLMLLSKGKTKYSKLKDKLTKNAMNRFEKEKWHLGHTEKIVFLLDFLSCPFIKKTDKKFVVSTLKKNEKNIPSNESKINKIVNWISEKTWFVDWRDADWLEKRLRKKEYTFPYA